MSCTTWTDKNLNSTDWKDETGILLVGWDSSTDTWDSSVDSWDGVFYTEWGDEGLNSTSWTDESIDSTSYSDQSISDTGWAMIGGCLMLSTEDLVNITTENDYLIVFDRYG